MPQFLSWFTQLTLRSLDRLAKRVLPPDPSPWRQRIGRRGEEDAYFYLRKLGYVMVARNYRSPHHHGEIDLIGWDQDVLCFIEVKTRSTLDVKPAEAAVDRAKRQQLMAVAKDYLRHLPLSCQWRFDLVSVYYLDYPSQPTFELFKNSCPVSYN